MTLNKFLMSTAVAALLAGPAMSQDTTGNTDTGVPTDDAAPSVATTTDPGAAAPAVEYTTLEEMTVGDMLGLSVVSADGESIGEVENVIADASGASVVMGIGGFLGIGEHTVALPLSDFQYDAEQRVLTLGTDRETLEAQPEFDDAGVEGLPDETPLADLMAAEPGTGGTGTATGTTEEGAADTGSTSEEDPAAGGATDEAGTDEEAGQDQASDG